MTFKSILDQFESALVELAVRLAGWLAPLPAAYAAYTAGTVALGWPVPVAIGAALAVESLGLATTHTALTLWRYNLAKRKSDPSAPVGYALALVAVYFVAALTLVLLVHQWPAVIGWAPGLFPVLSLAGVGTLALRDDHRRRVATVASERQAASEARKAAARERKAEARESKEQARRRQAMARELQGLGNARATLELYASKPTLSQSKAAASLGLSRQAVGQHLTRLEALGMIERNGHGVELLVDLPENGKGAADDQ